jgi:lysine 2,3-aminomutase
MFAAMTDIGKIIFYDGVILERKDNHCLLQSNYKLEDRLAWNPSWEMPDNAEVDDNGYLRVWYLDGVES